MKKIEVPDINVTMTLEEACYVNKLISRDTEVDGLPVDDSRFSNKCPVCGNRMGYNAKFCAECGQRIKFVESDDIPL